MVLIVLILGICASAGATLAVQRAQERLATQAMDHYINDLSSAIADEVSHYGDALTDLAVGASAQDHFTYTDLSPGFHSSLLNTNGPEPV